MDDRCSLPQFSDAKEKELSGAKQRNVYDFVSTEEAHLECQRHNEAPNTIGFRLVLSTENVEAPNTAYRARHTAQGHPEREKESLVHD